MSTGTWTTEDLTGDSRDRVPCPCGKHHPVTPPTTPAQTPATEAGRQMATVLRHAVTTGDMSWMEFASDDIDAAVVRIEAAARAEALAELRRGVEGLATDAAWWDDEPTADSFKADVLDLLGPKP